MANDVRDREPTYERMVETVKESQSQEPEREELYFDPASGQLVVSKGTPATRRSAVAAGTLAREGFFSFQEAVRRIRPVLEKFLENMLSVSVWFRHAARELAVRIFQTPERRDTLAVRVADPSESNAFPPLPSGFDPETGRLSHP